MTRARGAIGICWHVHLRIDVQCPHVTCRQRLKEAWREHWERTNSMGGKAGWASKMFFLLFSSVHVYVLSCFSCVQLFEYMDLSLRLPCPWDFPGKNAIAGCYAFLQGSFQTQGSNSCLLLLLRCRWILYCESVDIGHLDVIPNWEGLQFWDPHHILNTA